MFSRRNSLVLALGVALVVLTAVPVQAFILRPRQGTNGLFRDVQVCTDGISFEVASSYVIPGGDLGLGVDPPASPFERLHITTSDSLDENPIDSGIADPGEVLAGQFAVSEIFAGSEPWDFIAANQGNSPEFMDQFRWFYASYERAWSQDLSPGDQLRVFLTDGSGDPAPDEVITVTNCTLFGDPPPPPPPPPPAHPCDHPDAIVGTEGNDKLKGTSGDDIICGLGGNDRIFSYGGNDLIYAGEGNDKVHAGKGDDTVFGEGGNDKLLGQWGNDTLDGGEGNDKVHGSGGDDVLIGGPGHDRLLGGQGHDTLTQ